MKKYFSKIFLKGIFIIPFLLISTVPVAAQSQNDVNPQFDASSTDRIYYELNYDCTNLEWPADATGYYRRIFSPIDGDLYSRIAPQEFQEKNAPYAQTYFLFANETIIDIETDESKLTGVGDRADRIVVTPELLTSELAQTIVSKEDIEGLVGNVVCFNNKSSVGGTQIEIDRVVPANFVPPALQQIENIFLDLIYIVWTLLGIFALISLIYLGFKFMFQGFSPEQKGDVKSRLGYWVLGLIGAFLAIPALQFVYGLLGINHSECYYQEQNGEVVYDLTLPGFTVFFSDVCTGPFGVQETPPSE